MGGSPYKRAVESAWEAHPITRHNLVPLSPCRPLDRVTLLGYLEAMQKTWGTLIKIGPEVNAELLRLKRSWRLQSYNKVLKRLLRERNGQERPK